MAEPPRHDDLGDNDLEIPAWLDPQQPDSPGLDHEQSSEPDAPEPDAPEPDGLDDGNGGESRGTSRAARTAARTLRRRQRRRLRVILAALVALFVVPVLVFGAWFWYELDPPGKPGAEVALDVPAGWGVKQIGDALQREGVIGSSFVFQLDAKIKRAGPFQAGHYQLRKDLGVRAAIERLERGPKISYTQLALPPGLTLSMVASVVGKLPGRSAEKFLEVAESGLVRSKFQPPEVSSLEGLTWPDTYFVDKKQDEAAILQMIVTRFDEEIDKQGLSALPVPSGVSQYQALIVASLIQTEAKLDEDRPLIAGVIYNRLRDGTQLQIDATVLYARGHREGAITKSDLALESPYNTYEVKGLPPTPISTLAPASIKAALAPADVPFRFYVLSDASGRHAFAATFEEHQQNVDAARKKGLVP